MPRSYDYGFKSALTSWQFGDCDNLGDDIRRVMLGQAIILAALVKYLSDRPCHLLEFMTAGNKIVEDRKLR